MAFLKRLEHTLMAATANSEQQQQTTLNNNNNNNNSSEQQLRTTTPNNNNNSGSEHTARTMQHTAHRTQPGSTLKNTPQQQTTAIFTFLCFFFEVAFFLFFFAVVRSFRATHGRGSWVNQLPCRTADTRAVETATDAPSEQHPAGTTTTTTAAMGRDGPAQVVTPTRITSCNTSSSSNSNSNSTSNHGRAVVTLAEVLALETPDAALRTRGHVTRTRAGRSGASACSKGTPAGLSSNPAGHARRAVRGIVGGEAIRFVLNGRDTPLLLTLRKVLLPRPRGRSAGGWMLWLGLRRRKRQAALAGHPIRSRRL